MMLTILLSVTPPVAAIPAWAFATGLALCLGAVVVLSVVKRGRGK